MFNNINYRILLIIMPIIACTVAHFLAFSSAYAPNIINVSDNLCCGFFAISVATIMPNASKKWMIGGTLLSYCLILYLLTLGMSSFRSPCIIAALLAPITCSVFTPGTNAKRRTNSMRLNYFMAGLFLILISSALVPVVIYLYTRIESIINSTYLNAFYSENISFIYGMLFQFLQTVGAGHFITELRTISPDANASISFYATTTALNFVALPAIFIAIAINQDHRRRIFWGTFTLASFLCPPAGTAVSLLLLTLLLRYPFLYAFYMILCIIFYFVGQYVDFSISIVPEHFYCPDLIPTEIAVLRPKFILFATLAFITTLNFTNIVIQQNKADNEYKTNAMPLVNAIKIDFSSEETTDDYSFLGFQYIKALGGFNNITFCRQVNNHLLVNILNENQIDRTTLEKLCLYKVISDNNNNIVELNIGEHCEKIKQSIELYAKRLFIDLSTEYRDIPPFDIMKSDFKTQFAIKESSENSRPQINSL